MKPIIYSTQRTKHFKEETWKRGGQSVSYEQSVCLDGVNYYRLSFTYDFEYLEDTVYFAYSFPYGYTDLRKFIDRLSASSQNNRLMKKSVLCRTLLNHNVYLLEITNPSKDRKQERKQKK